MIDLTLAEAKLTLEALQIAMSNLVEMLADEINITGINELEQTRSAADKIVKAFLSLASHYEFITDFLGPEKI